uniref:Uncharacterized protein n=1 Tax=Anguilla anguilla TaxID=7936 RepID=A0A0E9TWU4_ANGAN
MFHNHIALGI